MISATVSHHPDLSRGPNLGILPARVFPRTRRCPPPVEDDVDLIGYALLLLLFLAAVWQ